MPASRYKLLVLVGFRQPVIIRQAPFRAGSSFWHGRMLTILGMHIRRPCSRGPVQKFSGYEVCIGKFPQDVVFGIDLSLGA